jgi:hypothetical protein
VANNLGKPTITKFSRDWVVMKLPFHLTYGTNADTKALSEAEKQEIGAAAQSCMRDGRAPS